MENKNSKKKNNTSIFKKIGFWFKGILASIGVLSSLTALELTTGFDGAEHSIDKQIDIENKAKDIFEKNENILTIAKKLIAYEYNKNKNEDEKITTEDIEITIEHGYSKANPFGVDFKRDDEGNKYASIVSSEGSEYGGYGTIIVVKITDGDKTIIVKGAKQNEIVGPVPAYYENEKIDVENDKNNCLIKNYNILANLVTAYKNERTDREVEKYKNKARKLLKDYIEQEGTEAVDYLMNDSEEFVNSENNKFKVSMKPITTHINEKDKMPTTTYEVTNKELAEKVLGSGIEVTIPEVNDNDEQTNDER